MIRNLSLIFSLILCLQLPLFGQVFNISPKEAAKLSGRKLIVVAEEKSKYPSSKKANELIRSVVASHWKATPYEIKSASEVKELQSKGSKEYVTLRFASLKDESSDFPANDTVLSAVDRYKLFKEKKHGYFELSFIEQFNKYALYRFYTPVNFPVEADFNVAVQQISNYLTLLLQDKHFSEKDYEEFAFRYSKGLADRTLLVDSLFIKRLGKKLPDYKSDYNWKYKLTSLDEIAKYTTEKDSSVAYLVITPYIDLVTRGNSFEGTAGGGMDKYEGEFYYAHMIIDPFHGIMISFIRNEEETYIDRRNFRQYKKFTEGEEVKSFLK